MSVQVHCYQCSGLCGKSQHTHTNITKDACKYTRTLQHSHLEHTTIDQPIYIHVAHMMQCTVWLPLQETVLILVGNSLLHNKFGIKNTVVTYSFNWHATIHGKLQYTVPHQSFLLLSPNLQLRECLLKQVSVPLVTCSGATEYHTHREGEWS